MVQIIFSAMFTAVLSGFCLTGILAFAEDFKENKTLIGRCMFISTVGGLITITGALIWLVWSIALAQ